MLSVRKPPAVLNDVSTAVRVWELDIVGRQDWKNSYFILGNKSDHPWPSPQISPPNKGLGSKERLKSILNGTSCYL